MKLLFKANTFVSAALGPRKPHLKWPQDQGGELSWGKQRGFWEQGCISLKSSRTFLCFPGARDFSCFLRHQFSQILCKSNFWTCLIPGLCSGLRWDPETQRLIQVVNALTVSCADTVSKYFIPFWFVVNSSFHFALKLFLPQQSTYTLCSPSCCLLSCPGRKTNSLSS